MLNPDLSNRKDGRIRRCKYVVTSAFSYTQKSFWKLRMDIPSRAHVSPILGAAGIELRGEKGVIWKIYETWVVWAHYDLYHRLSLKIPYIKKRRILYHFDLKAFIIQDWHKTILRLWSIIIETFLKYIFVNIVFVKLPKLINWPGCIMMIVFFQSFKWGCEMDEEILRMYISFFV